MSFTHHKPKHSHGVLPHCKLQTSTCIMQGTGDQKEELLQWCAGHAEFREVCVSTPTFGAERGWQGGCYREQPDSDSSSIPQRQ